MHSGFALWIPCLPSRCQTSACPSGPCLLAPHRFCVFSELRHKVNYRLDPGSTGSRMQHKHSCEGDVLLSWEQDRVVIGRVQMASAIPGEAASFNIHLSFTVRLVSSLQLVSTLENKQYFRSDFLFQLLQTHGMLPKGHRAQVILKTRQVDGSNLEIPLVSVFS